MMGLLVPVLMSLQLSFVVGFISRGQSFRPRHLRHHTAFAITSATRLFSTNLEDEVRKMSVRDLRKELDTLQVSTKDVFEKEELVARLVQAKKNGAAASPSSSSTSRSASNKDDRSRSANCITAPLYITSLNEGARIAANNIEGGITIPSGVLYPALKLTINNKTITLLLDTACTGFMLRPSVVKDCQLRVRQAPLMVMAAGGSMGQQLADVALLDDFTIGDHRFHTQTFSAAVQDMQVLEASSMDGIIGLSFLKEFAAVDLDFARGQLHMYRHDVPDVDDDNDSMTVLATCAMSAIHKVGGIFCIPVLLGGRGPVKMLVDTGASATILSWKGLKDLRLDESSKAVQRVDFATGSLGLDKVVMDLKHRIHVSSRMTLAGDKDSLPGVSLAGSGRLPIDIGSIPLLDDLASEGVGGILGIDALMRSSVCRLNFKGMPTITFFQ